MEISRTIISKTTDNRKQQLGHPNRKYLYHISTFGLDGQVVVYLRQYDRCHLNSNGKPKIFDHGEHEESIINNDDNRKWLPKPEIAIFLKL